MSPVAFSLMGFLVDFTSMAAPLLAVDGAAGAHVALCSKPSGTEPRTLNPRY